MFGCVDVCLHGIQTATRSQSPKTPQAEKGPRYWNLIVAQEEVALPIATSSSIANAGLQRKTTNSPLSSMAS